MKNWKEIGVYFCFIIGIIAAVVHFVYTNQQLENSIAKFDASEVKGTITDITHVRGVVTLTVGNHPAKNYTFDPVNTDSVDFVNVVLISDSIYKKAWDDTINIYHQKKLYQFVFRKPKK